MYREGSRRTQKHINDLLADFGAAPLSSYYLVAGGDRLPVRETLRVDDESKYDSCSLEHSLIAGR